MRQLPFATLNTVHLKSTRKKYGLKLKVALTWRNIYIKNVRLVWLVANPKIQKSLKIYVSNHKTTRIKYCGMAPCAVFYDRCEYSDLVEMVQIQDGLVNEIAPHLKKKSRPCTGIARSLMNAACSVADVLQTFYSSDMMASTPEIESPGFLTYFL